MAKIKTTPRRKKSTGIASPTPAKYKKSSLSIPKSTSKTNKSAPRTPTKKSTSSTGKKSSYCDHPSPASPASTASTSKVSTPSSKSVQSPKRKIDSDDANTKNVRKKVSKINLESKKTKNTYTIPDTTMIDWWSPKSLKVILVREGKVPVNEIKEMTHKELIKTVCENARFKPTDIKTVFPLLCRDVGVPPNASSRMLKSMQRTPDAVKRLIEVTIKLWNKNQDLDESESEDDEDKIPSKISVKK